MNVTIPTIVAFLMSSVIVPLFDKYEIPLTVAQQAKFGTWITGALMLAVTLATHFTHQKIKADRARKAAEADVSEDAGPATQAPTPPSATSIGKAVSGTPIKMLIAVPLIALLHRFFVLS